MKTDIHPIYETIEATCSCGSVTKARSALCKSIHLDVRPECHPFCTDKQKMLDTSDHIDHFKQRLGVFSVTK